MIEASLIKAAAYLGAAISVGAAAIGAALGEGYAAGEANAAISYRPRYSAQVLTTMLVGQAVAETPGIFGLVVAIVLIFAAPSQVPLTKAFAYVGAGFSMGFSGIGPGLGSGFPVGSACQGIVRQPEMSGDLMKVMLIGQAISQSTAIYGLAVALALILLA
ncbi:MAG: ATP synthase F0 subunit C [Deltaproteobacteria bacterium]|nr:ATP synthase F0 subunit C [Deltaproteobacteria bacterium]MBW2068028.1 ATP synthase F0 subunit C [Deltaproteobacteria bacterium]